MNYPEPVFITETEISDALASFIKEENDLLDFIKNKNIPNFEYNIKLYCEPENFIKHTIINTAEEDIQKEIDVFNYIKDNKKPFAGSDFAVTVLVRTLPNVRKRFKKELEELIHWLINNEQSFKNVEARYPELFQTQSSKI